MKVGADVQDDIRRAKIFRETLAEDMLLVSKKVYAVSMQQKFLFSVQYCLITVHVLTALTFIVYHYKIIVSFIVKIGYFYQMVDANQKWEVQEAIDWMKQMKDYKILWIEEPTNPDDVMGHAAIAEVRVKYAILNNIKVYQ